MHIVILIYLFLYVIPMILLDILQIRYVRTYSKEKPVILEQADYMLAANYAIAQGRLNIFSHIFEFFILLFWLLYGITYFTQVCSMQNINELFGSDSFFAMNEIFANWLILMCFIAFNAIIQLPFGFVKKRIDTHFGFNKQSSSSFFIDTLKIFLLGGIFIGIFCTILLWVMQNIAFWWIAGFVLLFGFIILLQLIYPTLIAPIFNKFTPLEDEQLKQRIQTLMEQIGFRSNGIFIMDASKRDGRLNAYFGGLGSSKRVVLFDTLLEKINQDGLIAILGHELGHFKHKDIIRGIFVAGLILFIMFGVIGIFFEMLCVYMGFEVNNAVILILAMLLLPQLSFIIMPIQSYFSRKAEYRADEFGASCASSKDLREALICLVNENKAFPYSHPAYIFFYYSHPPLIERLHALEALDDRN